MGSSVRISRDGYSVFSSEPREFVLHSGYSSVKIITTGSGTLTVGAGSTANVEINHGLSFAPLVLFFCELSPGSGKWFSGAAKYGTGDADAGDVYVEIYIYGNDYAATYVDTTKFRLMLANQGASSKDIKYFYIFFGEIGE
jgi:hypothetical protein